MKLYKHVAAATFLFLFMISGLYSQTDSIGNKQIQVVKNPEGTEFWLCFMRNYKDPEKKPNDLMLELFITGDKNANVEIEIKSIGYKEKVFVQAGTVRNIKLSYLAQVRSNETVEHDQAVHVVSDNPITVYGLNRRYQTTDTYLGMPTEVLGKEYRVICYYVSDPLLPQFAVVASEDATEVTITPSAETYSGRPAGRPFTIYMNKGDVYQVSSLYKSLASKVSTDLTGSLVKSNKKISVFSGHQCAYVPAPPPVIIACNHLAEQLPPITSWGKHFYIGRLKSRSKYSYRVLAHYPNTKVFVDANLVQILEPGQFMEKISDKNLQITADKPVLVAQYSQGFRNGDSIGDPMMLLISPTQQFLKKYRFATPVNGEWEHLINVVSPTRSIGSMKLDGSKVDSMQFTRLGISRYSIASLKIPFGAHIIEGEMPFGMYSYGFGYGYDAFDAYGSMGGQSFMDYEPVNDTIAPQVEERIENGKINLIVRDDGVDDTGIKTVIAAEKMNIECNVPDFEEGSPQIMFSINPQSPNLNGRAVFAVTDLALNTSYYTVCYSFDQSKARFVLQLNEGDNIDCKIDPGFQIGLFAKVNYGFHDASFNKAGDIKAEGKFEKASASSFTIGASISRRVLPKLVLTGKLFLDKYNGELTSADTSIYKVRDPVSGELKPFQEGWQVSLKGLYLNLAAGAEYYLSNILYASGGLNFALNMSKSADVYRNIILPSDYKYQNGKRSQKSESISEISSINTLRLGVYGGLGVNVPIRDNFSGFAEANYNYFFGNIISDGNWSYNQFSILFGIQYRI